MSTQIGLSFHQTEEDMYVALRRVFNEQENAGTRWVELVVDGVRLTFFAPTEVAKEPLLDIDEVLA